MRKMRILNNIGCTKDDIMYSVSVVKRDAEINKLKYDLETAFKVIERFKSENFKLRSEVNRLKKTLKEPLR